MNPDNGPVEASKVSLFVGRANVLDELDEWLASDSPCVIVLGEPGTGKTALARHIVNISEGLAAVSDRAHMHPEFITYAHFCRAQDYSTLDPLRFVERLANAIANRYEPYAETLLNVGDQHIELRGNSVAGTIKAGGKAAGVLIETLRIGNLSAALALERLVSHPLSQLAENIVEPAVVVIDALDEALTLTGDETLVNVLSDLIEAGALPASLRLIITSRPDPRVTDRLIRGPCVVVDLQQDVAAAIEDIRTYARDRLATHSSSQAKRIAAQIARMSAGNFLYARYAVDDLLSGQDTDEEDFRPPNDLHGIYTRFVERELARSEARWDDCYRPLLGLLAVAQGQGLPRDVLLGASGLPRSRVDHALRVLAQYLDSESASTPLRIYHQSFREFICADGPYSVYPQEAEEILIDWLLAQRPASEPNGQPSVRQYAFEHLATHAAACNRLGEVIDAGFLPFAEPFAMRRALRASHSWFLSIYEDAFASLVGHIPAQRVLALRLAALRAGNQTLDGRLAELSLKQVISPAWAMIDPSQPPIWQRRSLSASKFAVGELRGSLAVALLEDTADAPVIWEPETATEHPVPTIKPDITGELVLTTLKNRPALIQVGDITVAADAFNGEVLGRAWAPGRVAFLRRNGEAWLAEASPVHGAIWVRPLNSPDLWDSGSDNTISPSLAQRALEPVAVLPGKVRRLYPIETTGNPLIAAVDDQEDLFIIYPFTETPFVVGPLIKVNNFASKPFDSEINGDRPLLVVAVRDEQIAVAVLDGGTGERLATLNWTALDAAIDSAQSTSERREVEEVNFLNENGMPKLLIRTRWEDVLTTWDWSTGQLDVTVMAAGGMIKTTRYAGQALVLVGSDSGLSVFDQARLRKQRRAQRGPACVIAAADVKGSALTSWLAPGHDGSSTLWTAADDGTEVDKMRLPGSDPEFVALGHVRGKPVAVALPDRNRGDCYLRWLDGSDQIYLINIRTGWPDELGDFALMDLSTVHDDSNLLWAGEFLSRVVDSRISTDLESLLNSEFEASPGIEIAELVAVSAGGKAVVTGDRFEETVSLHNFSADKHAQIAPEWTRDRNTHLSSLAVTVMGKTAIVAAVVRHIPVARDIYVTWHDGRHAPRWKLIASTRSYESYLALDSISGRLALALGDNSGVRLFSPLEPAPQQRPENEYLIPQSATALRFDGVGRLMIGTTRGVMCVNIA